VNATTNCVGGILGAPLSDVGFDFSALCQFDGSTRFFHIEPGRPRVEIEYTWIDLKKLRALQRERPSSAHTN